MMLQNFGHTKFCADMLHECAAAVFRSRIARVNGANLQCEVAAQPQVVNTGLATLLSSDSEVMWLSVFVLTRRCTHDAQPPLAFL